MSEDVNLRLGQVSANADIARNAASFADAFTGLNQAEASYLMPGGMSSPSAEAAAMFDASSVSNDAWRAKATNSLFASTARPDTGNAPNLDDVVPTGVIEILSPKALFQGEIVMPDGMAEGWNDVTSIVGTLPATEDITVYAKVVITTSTPEGSDTPVRSISSFTLVNQEPTTPASNPEESEEYSYPVFKVRANGNPAIEQIHVGLLILPDAPAEHEVEIPTCAFRVVKDGTGWKVLRPTWVVGGVTHMFVDQSAEYSPEGTVYAQAKLVYSSDTLTLQGQGESGSTFSVITAATTTDLPEDTEIIPAGQGSSADDGEYYIRVPIGTFSTSEDGTETFTQIHEGVVVIDAPTFILSYVPSAAEIEEEGEVKYLVHRWWANYNYPDKRGLIVTNTVSNILLTGDQAPCQDYHSKVEIPSGGSGDTKNHDVRVYKDGTEYWLAQGLAVDGNGVESTSIPATKILRIDNLFRDTGIMTDSGANAIVTAPYSWKGIDLSNGLYTDVSATAPEFGTGCASVLNGYKVVVHDRATTWLGELCVNTPLDETEQGNVTGYLYSNRFFAIADATIKSEEVYFYTEVANSNTITNYSDYGES